MTHPAENCERFQEALQAEQRGESISETVIEAAEDHIDNCQSCAVTCEVFQQSAEYWPLYEGQPEILSAACSAHFQNCTDCNDDMTRIGLERKGVRWKEYPCLHIAYYVQHECTYHETAWDCADTMLVDMGGGVFGLPIRDGGRAYIPISNCPWCGISLKESAKS